MRDSPSLGSVGCPLQHPLRRFDVHPLDHFIAEALCAAMESIDQRLGALNFCRAWRKSTMTWGDLIGVDQALAVETKPSAGGSFRDEAFGILKAVEYPIEHRDPGGARSKHRHL